MKKREKKKSTKRRQPKGSQYLSIDAASLAFSLIFLANNEALGEHLTKLALRGPDFIKELVIPILMQQGKNIEIMMQGEPTTTTTKEEVMEAVKPLLKEGTRVASFAQLLDLYLLQSPTNPENMVYVFYIGSRYFIAREQKPTKLQSKLIWEITLHFVQKSIIGARHWKALEAKGPVYLEEWLEEVKETARKKFKTFLSQKKRAEKTADKAFKGLVSFIFDKEVE